MFIVDTIKEKLKGKAVNKKLEFPLGEVLRDKVTGVEGIALSRAEFINGCIQYNLQPRCGDNTQSKPDQLYFDYQRLERVDDRVVGLFLEEFKQDYRLGIKVRDKITGMTGTTILHTVNITGLEEYSVQPYMVKKDGQDYVPDPFYVFDATIEVIEEKPVEMPRSDRGGPGYKPGRGSMMR